MNPKLEDLIPLESVCRKLPTRTHRSTVFRWAQRGRHGVKLRVVTVGSTKCTTEAWLMEFFAGVEAARYAQRVADKTASPQAAQRPRRRPDERPSKTTEAILIRHGLVDPKREDREQSA